MVGLEHRLRPGDVFVAGGKKTVYLTVGLWLKDDGQIHISLGKKGITTVSNNPKYKRYHKNLYAKLKSILQENERWNPQPTSRHLEDPSQLTISCDE